jgi:Tol biopolymer transport system component
VTVTAPPRPPKRRDPVAARPRDPVERSDPEALIEEARQRARRRRLTYAAGAVLALIGVSLVTILGRGEPSESAAAEPAARPAAAGAAVNSQLAVGIFSGGRNELYVMNPDGDGLRLLTSVLPLYEGNVGGVWSPDGRKILFGTTIRRGGIASEEVMVVNADGSGERVLSNDPASDGGAGWSPDGRKILVGRASYSSNDVGVYVINADGSGERKRADGDPGAWSPDGQKIAFGRDGAVWVMNADGSGQQPLTSRTSSLPDFPGQWSPDGAKITFSRVVDLDAAGTAPGRVDLYVINADGSGERRLVRDVGFDGTWSPDGRQIAFARGSPSPEGIYVINADGSGERKLADGSGPVWSPDGQTIAFTRDRAVWIMNADGSGQRRLTPALGQIYDPSISWSPSQ